VPTIDRDLRITRRCRVHDLNLPEDSVGRAQDHVDVHRVVLAFVERRLQDPTGQETFRCATEASGKTIYTLHAGTDRGATWHDLDEGDDDNPALDVVWLLGCRPDHDYDTLCDLARREVLLPDEADYEALFEEDLNTFAKAIAIEVPALVLAAEQHRGEVIEGVLAERIPVRLYRDPDDEAPLFTVAIRVYPMPGTLVLHKRWFERILLAFFQVYPADLSTVDFVGDEDLREGEIAFCDFPAARS
jgi:hypothetical protein